MSDNNTRIFEFIEVNSRRMYTNLVFLNPQTLQPTDIAFETDVSGGVEMPRIILDGPYRNCAVRR